MGYEAALKKAWENLVLLEAPKNLSVKFLADEYSVDTAAEKILSLSSNTPAKAFVDVPVLIKMWKQDSEFGPDANMYFDASIKNIFCTEDIVVLAQMVSSQL